MKTKYLVCSGGYDAVGWDEVGKDRCTRHASHGREGYDLTGETGGQIAVPPE